MWTLDLQNGRLLPVWTKADGRIADATIVYVPHSRAFVLVGDMDVYKKIYGDAWETVSLSHLAWNEMLSVFCADVYV